MTATSPQKSYYLEPEKDSTSKVIIKKSSKLVYTILQIVVGAGILGMILYFFITPFNQVSGPSMQPNFCNKDIYITYKLPWYFNPMSYKRGDVLSFKLNSNENLIKRVIGLPGDVIKVENEKLYLNGQPLNEPYMPEGVETKPFNTYLFDGFDYEVPKGTYFVMGDNRPNSIDSRAIGPIEPYKENALNGSVIAVIWPPQRMRLFNNNQVYPLTECDDAPPGH